MVRKALAYTAALVLAVLIGALLVGQVFGVPVAISYVETGSMEPTLDPGDGFVAIPAEVAGPVEKSDVVTFEAQDIQGGGLTTHRVVEIRDQGYVTQGDANPFTDQDSGEPLVTDGQVAAKALQMNGAVVRIPHLGTAVMSLRGALEWVQVRLAGLFGTRAFLGTQGLAYLLFGFGASLLLIGFVRDLGRSTDRSRKRRRSREGIYDGRLIVVILTLFLVAVTAGTMVVASGTTEVGIVSAEFDSDRPDVIPQGETEAYPRTLGNDGLLPMVVVLEPASEGVAVNESVHHLERGERTNVSIAYSAPPETGHYLRTTSEYRYFGVLPTATIHALHAIHPWMAVGVITLVIVAPLVIVVLLVFGTGRLRTRDRRRESKPGLF